MSVNLNDLTPLEWRRALTDDLPELFGLLAAIATFDDASQRWSLEELRERHAAGAEENGAGSPIMVGFDETSPVAVGWNTSIPGSDPGVRLDGAVHPAYRHQGIGRALLRWQMAVARASHARSAPGQDLRMLGFSDATLTGKRHLYEWQGLSPTRWFIDMMCRFPPARPVAEYLATPALGIDFRPLVPELVEATRAAHNEAFAARFGSRELGPEDWAASLRRDGARADLSWLAVDEYGRVVGYALNSELRQSGTSGLGWTDRLGVRPSHRGRSIARILLARSLASFHQAGLEGGGIGLDSVDGRGTDLYRLFGYEATDTIIQYELVDPSVTKGGV